MIAYYFPELGAETISGIGVIVGLITALWLKKAAPVRRATGTTKKA